LELEIRNYMWRWRVTKTGRRKAVSYVSRASPRTISTFFTPLSASASSAILAYSALYSKPVTFPSGPTAWDQTMAEYPT